MPLPDPGTTPGSEILNGPPPSPAIDQGVNPGMPPIGQMVPPLPTASQPPQVLTGILQAGEQMVTMIDAFAQATPEIGADWAAAKSALQTALSKVMQAGAPPTTPTAPGPSFPGGGIDRGGMPSASGGM